MSDEPKKRTRARVLMAILWGTVALTAWLFFWRFADGQEGEWLAWLHATGLFVAPCVAFGTAVGRPRLWAAIGLAILFMLSAVLTVAGIYGGRTH